ncbi:ABC transporter ATP-binding protein [Halobacillus aidingensis]|uniref:Branched-chain amino acid transport system ATP-binding protein n=1 Tax=Halobacillus aidingensis TaxID=240303 RepID=A0A1H0S7L7_HALAD|nr:ABC transporter ATP-binding protein [Halobacillus aidingensis]SDP37801.1 branched-chain amino acid transport system ATP-binding protein [Halobacillus aidingensis]
MLKVNNIEVVYSKMILVLKGMSIEVPDGDIVALLGSNGAGKSTTLKAISGLLGGDNGQVTKGRITYQEEDLTSMSPDKIVQKGIFQSMEGRRVFKHLTVEENLTAGAHTRKDRRNIKNDMERVYHYFPKLKTLRTRHAGLLSGGEQQMLAIGRGIMAKPKLLLLDEPSLGIAPLLVKEIFQNIKQINEEEGMSILVVEQNANVALSIADYGYIIEDGRSVLEAPVSELLSNQEVQEHYLGMNEEGRKNYRDVKSYRKKQRWI